MNRLMVAVVCLVLGTAMFGIAFGLVYIDIRNQAVAESHKPIEPPPTARAGTPEPKPSTPPGLIVAMAIGPLGAGMVLAGGLLGVVSIVSAWRGRGSGPSGDRA